MQKHAVLGASVLLQNRESDELAVAAAYGHHCTLGGTGHPWTCDEFHAQTVTKLVKICDCYEALTAVRPYKKAISPLMAYKTMFSMKDHFDLRLLGHFVRTIGIYPLGTNVRLDDGSLARVTRQTKDLRKPDRRPARGGSGVPAIEDQRQIDLTAPPPGDPASVAAWVAPARSVAALV